jgi:hypothetical protein
MAHYMEYMWPALFSRASHPVFAGQAVAQTMDLVGLEGASQMGLCGADAVSQPPGHVGNQLTPELSRSP